jgi:diaminohydroxyphosphoribosylaminopyrimidine deaminase/5-amino-6-(5-phosphoribosylamino)uracil reductase
MRMIEMNNALWARLLAMRGRCDLAVGPGCDPALALYGPIATAGEPFVLAQVGQSLDGRVATPTGDARDISGPDGIAHLHRCRALVDAVIVGVGTVKCDDPRLSVRVVEGPDPVRVIVDCRAELSGEERLFDDGGAPVILLQAHDAEHKRYPAEVIRIRRHANGLDPRAIVDVLGQRGLGRILVEGGARTIARFIAGGLVDRLHVAIAPLIIGSGPTGICLPPIDQLSGATRPAASVYNLGSDILFDCDLRSEGEDTSAFAKRDQVRVADHA